MTESISISTATSSKGKAIAGIIICLIAWLAIIVQLILMTGTITNFFSFFTIQCNLLIAVSLTCINFFPKSSAAKFFSRPSVVTGIGLYIFIVGFVYNIVLRKLVSLSGLSLLVDNTLHVFIPILYLMYWMLFTKKDHLPLNSGLRWLWFPFFYLVYTLIRGSFVDWYPYPFLNAAKLGYEKVIVNILVMLAVFLIAGIVLIAISRMLAKKQDKSIL